MNARMVAQIGGLKKANGRSILRGPDSGKPGKRQQLAFAKANTLFEAHSGMTLEQLGEKMGYGPGTARKAAWGFLKKTTDPRLSTLESLAKALGVEVKDLF